MASSQDTEITLGTGKLLVLFFGLVGLRAFLLLWVFAGAKVGTGHHDGECGGESRASVEHQ